MKVNDLTIDVNARVTVSDETVERCLRIIEMWIDDNPDKTILGEKMPMADGRERTLFRINTLRKEKKDG